MAQAISLPALPTPHHHRHHNARPSRAHSPSKLRADSPLSAALRAGDGSSSFRDARFLVSLLRQCGDLLHGEDEAASAAPPTHIFAARRLAPQLHSLAVRAGHAAREPHVACALADLLARLGRGASSRRLLAEGEAEAKDAVLWNKQAAMLAEAEDWAGAIAAFREMQARGVPADGYACARVLHACGRAAGEGCRREGRAVHAHALKAGHVDAHPLVPGFLAGMYAEGADVAAATSVLLRADGASAVAWNAVIACCVRLGMVDDAIELAERMARNTATEPTLTTWNTVLSGCARHGRDREAVAVVRRLLEQGLSPDATTVSSLLKSVANAGALGHGTEVHGFFLRHHLVPDAYTGTGTAPVDMYAKCGRLDRAQRML